MKLSEAQKQDILKLVEDSDGYLLIIGVPTNSVVICEGDCNSIAPALKASYQKNDLLGQMISYAVDGEELI